MYCRRILYQLSTQGSPFPIIIDDFNILLELSCFFDDLADVGNLTSGYSAFSKSSLNIWKVRVHVLLNLAFRILSITFLACEMSTIVW